MMQPRHRWLLTITVIERPFGNKEEGKSQNTFLTDGWGTKSEVNFYSTTIESSCNWHFSLTFTDIDGSLGNESKMPESREKFPDHFSGKVHFSTVLGNKIFPSPNYFPPNSEHPMSIDKYFRCFSISLV